MSAQEYSELEREVERTIQSAIRGSLKLMILRILSEKTIHGYELIKEIERRTLGLWKPVPGSIYPALKLLENKGFVESYSQKEKGKIRKYYKITDKGLKLLKIVDARLNAIRSYIISSLPRSREILREYTIAELQDLLKRLNEWKNILTEVLKIIEDELKSRTTNTQKSSHQTN